MTAKPGNTQWDDETSKNIPISSLGPRNKINVILFRNSTIKFDKCTFYKLLYVAIFLNIKTK